MSHRKKSSDNPMPATGAGLLRFYSESDSPGIKIGPWFSAAFSIGIIILILIINVFIKP